MLFAIFYPKVQTQTRAVVLGLRIILAADGNKLDVIQLLLDHGADPNINPEEAGTPLIYSARHPNLVNLLLVRGANPNIGDEDGMTPLMHVVRHKPPNMEVIEALLQHGADIYITDKRRRTALLYAKDENTRNMLMRYYGRSLYHKRDRSKSYLSQIYSDVDILVMG